MINYPQYTSLPDDYIERKIREFLAEDSPNGDITTSLTIDEKETTIAELLAEQDLIFVGEKIIPHFFSDKVKVEIFAKDGDLIQNGGLIAKFTGMTREILTVERTLLNLIQRLCGIATELKKFTEVADKYSVKILDTRKTIPGLRLFDKYAIAAAGGKNHRLDLSSGILIKDNHIANKDLFELLTKVKNNNASKLPIELEVDNIQQLKIGLSVGIDGFLLDNFKPSEVRIAVDLIRKSRNGNEIFVEASGGINLSNFRDYLDTGINAISVGALTHSVKAANIHLEFSK